MYLPGTTATVAHKWPGRQCKSTRNVDSIVGAFALRRLAIIGPCAMVSMAPLESCISNSREAYRTPRRLICDGANSLQSDCSRRLDGPCACSRLSSKSNQIFPAVLSWQRAVTAWSAPDAVDCDLYGRRAPLLLTLQSATCGLAGFYCS